MDKKKKIRGIFGRAANTTIKALPESLMAGRRIKGPDYGDNNPPVLFHSRKVSENTRYRYVVGHHKWIAAAINALCEGRTTGAHSHQEDGADSLVLFYRGYAPSKRYFSDLCKHEARVKDKEMDRVTTNS